MRRLEVQSHLGLPRAALYAVAALLLVAGVAGASLWLRHDAPAQSAKPLARYTCPMHRDYTSDHPGNCPICSMQLVPVDAGAAASERAETATAPARSAARVQISVERQQQIGVRFAEVVRVPASVEIHAVGKVAFDETQITHVHSKVSGWIEDVSVDFVGAPVKKGQPLFTLYSPDLVASQQEYLLALRANRELGKSPFPRIAGGSRALVESARERLRLWDMTPAQVQALEKRGEVSRTVTIFSPVSGSVVARAAYHHGLYVTPDLDLYTIVPLDRVWVVASIYEYELAQIAVGQAVEATLPYDPAHAPLQGTVSFIQPFLDPATRTVQVRFEFPNPDLALKPETFVNVTLRKELGPSLVIPREALMDTGASQYVFVDRGNGYLEPRTVRAGAEVAGGRLVLEGLEAGERVVSAANFIIDSESRLTGAFDAMTRPAAGDSAAAAPALQVELASDPTPAKVGANRLRVRLADASGAPLADARVEVRFFMPAMGNMPPMESRAELKEEGPGSYAGSVELSMAGTWQASVQAHRGEQALGSAQTSLTVR